MSTERQDKSLKKNDFYAASYNSLMIIFIIEVVLVSLLLALLLYQIRNRPLPTFVAVTPAKQRLQLAPSTEPNLLPATLIRWASKAAVSAYTFDFVNYNKQIALARPYFTEAGWKDYQASIADLIQTITQNQLFVNGVVSAPPVISNQGDLPGRGYTWRIQVPFLVTYQSAGQVSRANYTVVITIVRVSTSVNPAGIGIDQFVMG
ncbi:MAG TPA: DotI/IcmL family type IV secretion protein [Gammaproteobacteria bacterium]|nr:DotI/IcmL family type IV secretion protein [Gammaproteobacteria bacterium]